MARRPIDEVARAVLDALPPGLADAESDLRQNLRAGLTAVLARMDLITREEFDAQARVLARSREKLEVLEERVRQLEATPAEPPPGD